METKKSIPARRRRINVAIWLAGIFAVVAGVSMLSGSKVRVDRDALDARLADAGITCHVQIGDQYSHHRSRQVLASLRGSGSKIEVAGREMVISSESADHPRLFFAFQSLVVILDEGSSGEGVEERLVANAELLLPILEDRSVACPAYRPIAEEFWKDHFRENVRPLEKRIEPSLGISLRF